LAKKEMRNTLMKEYKTYYSSPIGVLEICASDKGITRLDFVKKRKTISSNHAILAECKKQLDKYFKGTLKTFTLPLDTQGTVFQKSVWSKLKKIPYGKTLSYGEIASKIKNPKASRAVGMANNKNKIAILLPCHRVIGSDGKLVGYASGVWRKKWLLEHEREKC